MSEAVVYSRSGRLWYWDSHAYPIVDELWACNLTEVMFYNDGSGTFCIEKGREDLVKPYVTKTADGHRPRLRLVCTEEEFPGSDAVAYIALDLEEFVDDPHRASTEHEFRWSELKLKRSLTPAIAKQ